MSPTQRTMKWLRDMGHVCGVVERWVPAKGMLGGGFRQDFLGAIDIISVGAEGIVGIQSCGSAFSEHKKKLMTVAEDRDGLLAWLEAGGKMYLVGWRQVVNPSMRGRRMIWKPRIEEITLDMLTGQSPEDPAELSGTGRLGDLAEADSA